MSSGLEPSATRGRSPRHSGRWHRCGCTPAAERARRFLRRAAAEDALDVADDQIDPLLDEGWRPEDVALLTTGARHPEQVALQESEGQEGYWRTFWDKDCVFYGHVLGCKGLERKVVVLCVNERMPRERSRERLYVGLSRATDKLVVVGPADVIREMGGPAVAQRLGIA